ncbi:MAG TPA: NADH-quinone oxidoreductase subunit NuoE [Gammaproteobacteria bacterium]|nr:NADH-quinone oxidoreductase subunit NuoE [Gammaproteobacteria bacterium]
MSGLTANQKKAIDQWVDKFPSDQKRSAVIMALRIVQKQEGYLTDQSLNEVAEYLSLPRIAVYEVASFYSMYRRKPAGCHTLKVCTSLSCCLRGAHSVIGYLEKKLKIRLGETTQDGSITLEEAECLAACTGAPMLMVDDHKYHENLTPEKLDGLVKKLKHSAKVKDA